jgi:hypothetical protein
MGGELMSDDWSENMDYETPPSAHELSAAFSSLASDGEYQLKEAALIEDGNQRDPYVTAVRLTFVKEAR